MTDQPTQSTLWVKTDPDADGTYRAAVEIADVTIPLTPDAAQRYATAVLTVAARADHTSLIMRQIVGLGVGKDEAAAIIMDMVADLPPLDDEAAAPLRFEPAVGQDRSDPDSQPMSPYVRLLLRDEPIAVMSVDAAREHATNVWSAVAMADLDNAYYRLLRGALNIDEARARNVISDLASHR